jgi:hypothetical protein
VPKNKLPAVKIEPHRNTQERLVVSGKTRLVANKIFHYGLFAGGNKIAAVYRDEHGINLAVIHLNEKIGSFLLLLPSPVSEMTFAISPDDKNAVVTYTASDGELYLAESDGMYVSRVTINDGSIVPLGKTGEKGEK